MKASCLNKQSAIKSTRWFHAVLDRGQHRRSDTSAATQTHMQQAAEHCSDILSVMVSSTVCFSYAGHLVVLMLWHIVAH